MLNDSNNSSISVTSKVYLNRMVNKLVDVEDICGIAIRVPNFNLIGYINGDAFEISLIKYIYDFLGDLGKSTFYVDDGKFYIFDYRGNFSDIKGLCESIIDKFSSAISINGIDVILGCNIAYLSSENIEKNSTFLGYLDFALKMSISSGKNTILECTESVVKDYNEYIKTWGNIDKALICDKFEVLYQPIVDIQNNSISRLEALVRLKTDRGLVTPNVFFPVLTDREDFVALDKIVVEKVCKFISSNNITKRVYVNITSASLGTKGFFDYLISTLNKYSIDFNLFGIEVLEDGILFFDKEKLSELDMLLNMGMGVAIDDFGTGYSSIYRLNSIPFSDLKISKELVDNIKTNSKVKDLLVSVVKLVRNFNCSITIEGVEDIETLNEIQEIGVNNVQGYHFYKPLDESDVLTILNK